MTLWTGSGLFNMELGQVIMIAIGLLLLFLAIRKGFEPLLLVPIGFGGILANIPEAGLALTAAENAIHFALKSDTTQVLAALAAPLDVAYQAGQAITPELKEAFKVAVKEASYSDMAMANAIAQDFGYGNGMLYNFYSVVIGSTIGPLVIFMGVGAMTDFGSEPFWVLHCSIGWVSWTSPSLKPPQSVLSVVRTVLPPFMCPVFWRRTCSGRLQFRLTLIWRWCR